MKDIDEKYVEKIVNKTNMSEEKAKNKIQDVLEEYSTEKGDDNISWLSVKGATEIILEEAGASPEETDRIDIDDVVEGYSGKVYARVVKKEEPKTVKTGEDEQHKVVNLYVGDNTDSISISLWDDNIEDVEDISKGDIVDISGARLKNGKMRARSIEKIQEHADVELPEADELSLRPERSIEELAENEGLVAKVEVTVVELTNRDRYYYEACPNCMSKVRGNTCDECNENVEEPMNRLFLPMKVEDGTMEVETTLWHDDIKEISGLGENISKVAEVNSERFYKKMKELLVGEDLEIVGEISEYQGEPNLKIQDVSIKKS